MQGNSLILIADDDRGTSLIMKKALKKSGFDVVEAENGREAVDAFKKHQPDLVLLDVVMPQMDGFEACRRIRAHPNGFAVPIVTITASDDFEAIGNAYDAGATDFFAKPIHMRVLSERVRYMLRSSATTRQLQQSQELLAKAQAISNLGSFSYKANETHLTVSDEFRAILGLTDLKQTVAWEAFWQKIHPDDRKNLTPLIQKAHNIGTHFRKDIRLIGNKNGNQHAMLQIDPEMDDKGRPVGMVGILQDITERKLSEMLERDQNHVMQLIVRKESLEDIFLETARLLERQCLQSMVAICKIEEKQIKSIISPSLPYQFVSTMTGTAISTGNGTCAAAAYLGQAVTAENIETSALWENKQKEALAHGLLSSAAVPVFSGTGQVLGTVAVMHRDTYHTTTADLELMERVSNLLALAIEQEHLSRELLYQAQHDPLTGLVNRGALTQWMSQTLKRFNRKMSLGAYMLIDLDRFKHINDSLGHHIGDLMLQQVAKRLRQCLRESDLLSRVGGDEFVLVLTEINDEEDAVRAASRILEAFKVPFKIEGNTLPIEASIGITLFPQDAKDGTVLHKNADIAMYVAKNQGGNRFHFFDSKMHEAVMQRLYIENDLRKALERGEFELQYQPQLDLASNELIVMEALIRWNHPERGVIPPKLFISVAEESRLIIPIGRWVLNEACRQNKQWQQQGYTPVRIAVNVSAVQFTETDFAGVVREVLDETALEPCWLEVEITETVVLKNMDKAYENLQKLKELGVKTVLDDFGTGYSSITYLREMPLDGIKIDQSFIRDMNMTPTANGCKNTNFLKAFATLAHNLRLPLVAEGIETMDQKQLLKSFGYDIGQGFLFSVPLPASEAVGLLSRPSSTKVN